MLAKVGAHHQKQPSSKNTGKIWESFETISEDKILMSVKMNEDMTVHQSSWLELAPLLTEEEQLGKECK